MGDIITVFGGSGFIGRHAVSALLRAGKRVRIAVRRPHLAVDCAALGRTGQVQVVQANLRFPESVAMSFAMVRMYFPRSSSATLMLAAVSAGVGVGDVTGTVLGSLSGGMVFS